MGALPLVSALALVLGTGVLSACTAPGPAPDEPDPGPTAAPTAAPTTAPPTTAPSAAFEQEIAAARAEVHERFGHPLAEIELVSAERVQWRDDSLGCPRTDRTYAPGPVDGYRLVLRWRDVTFDYHGAAGQLPFHCMRLDG